MAIFNASDATVSSSSLFFQSGRDQYSDELEFSVNEYGRTWIGGFNRAQKESVAAQMYFSLRTQSVFRSLILLIFIE
jgi:hypothetical protein